MGYFSNGTEGTGFLTTFCFQCVNADDEGTCPVYDAHLLFQGNGPDTQKVLDFLITPGVKGNRCRLYKPHPTRDLLQLPMFPEDDDDKRG